MVMERTITRRNGDTYTVLFDDVDLPLWESRTWGIQSGYAANFRREGGKIKCSYFHREILGQKNFTKERPFTDHVDRNRLNNTRCNLRIVSHTENVWNRKKPSITKNNYIGLYFKEQYNYWAVRVRCNGKVLFVGNFKSEIEAARAYDIECLRLKGDFAVLNFPERVEEYRELLKRGGRSVG